MAKIAWYVASLEQKGGGERFVLEAARALRLEGHDVTIVCDRFSPEHTFTEMLEHTHVVALEANERFHQGYLRRLFGKVLAVGRLYRTLHQLRADVVFCQSEFDAVRLALVQVPLRFRLRVFVFGQMYQFASDITKYARVFRRHLDRIRASRPGYAQTVFSPPPRLGWSVSLVNEVVSVFKLWALRRAERIYTLSAQVQWEVSLVYGRRAEVLRAAFRESFIDQERLGRVAPQGPPRVLLSVCRLVAKKRVDLIIRAFAAAGGLAELRIVGSGQDFEALQALARSLPVADRIVFRGSVPDEELLQELERADCFVSMDIGDFDITVFEAMAKGVRVIVAADFDVSSFPESMSGITVVEPQVDALATALRKLETAQAPGLANLAVLRELSWESLARRCMDSVSE